jgi:hypothetical protein
VLHPAAGADALHPVQVQEAVVVVVHEVRGGGLDEPPLGLVPPYHGHDPLLPRLPDEDHEERQGEDLPAEQVQGRVAQDQLVLGDELGVVRLQLVRGLGVVQVAGGHLAEAGFHPLVEVAREVAGPKVHGVAEAGAPVAGLRAVQAAEARAEVVGEVGGGHPLAGLLQHHVAGGHQLQLLQVQGHLLGPQDQVLVGDHHVPAGEGDLAGLVHPQVAGPDPHGHLLLGCGGRYPEGDCHQENETKRD